MTTTERKRIETELEAKRDELLRTIRGSAATLTLESGNADVIDHMQETACRDQIAIMLNRFSATLEDVERALRAISEDSYGICAMCDEPIAANRLKTIPWAPYCVRCQEQIERREISHPVHYVSAAQLAY